MILKMTYLNNISFKHLNFINKSLKPKLSQIYTAKLTIYNELRHGPANCRPLLYPMTGEPTGHVDVVKDRVLPYHPILVPHIVIIVSRPGRFHLDQG